MHLKTIEWISDRKDSLVPGRVRLIDQTKLPGALAYLEIADLQELWRAIKTLQVRGAPAIGVAAAMGVVIAVQCLDAKSGEEIVREVDKAVDYLATSRPTAINLFWALERMKKVAAAARNHSPGELKRILGEEALKIREEDAVMCRSIGQYGSTLLEDGFTMLTHCNAGGLATAEYGTALAPVYVAQEQGKTIRVFVDETRPLLQGSRLTAWELMQAGIDVTLICDHTAAHVMREGKINVVMVGADRIAANGDTANKVGTYSVAVSAHAHQIPFYVLAPTSSWDLTIRSGAEIPIEHRDRTEVVKGFGMLTAPEHVNVYSPAFDVTPANLITAIVCEKGIAKPPYEKSLRKLLL